ncbi:MAG: S8 family serine peptidase [Candidatus Doudnabacteria bacterium]|nr:S8 family serine peptidase [bacterium]MDZ4243495.1 S8 family serine peptidase [Candidatus Doudnabacteria bacterium]
MKKILSYSLILGVVFGITAVGVVGSTNSQVQAAGNNKVDVFIIFNQTPGSREQALVESHGGVIKHSYHLVPAIAASIPESAIAGLSRNPNITSIEPDGVVYAIDVELDNTWGVERIGSGTVHDDDNKGVGVKVAIIDSGIDYTHPDLDANFTGGYDFVNNDANPMDDNGHGTHVAGTVAAEDNDTGVVGVAPLASLYALKVLNSSGSGYWSNIIAALQWAVDNGMQVTNNSYGAGSDPGATVKAAFDNSAAAGIFHAAAAGNSGNCAGKGNNVGYPARYDSVMAVAATNKSDSRPCFSSTGVAVELSAPGVSINSTQLGGGYVKFTGTSMASPHVAGAAALVIAAGVTNNDEVRAILNSTADDIGATGKDTHYGYGLVNVAAAIASLVPPQPPDPAVNVDLSTDKTNYESGIDTTAILTAAIADENGNAISGLSPSDFTITVNVTTTAVSFAETATPGTYTGNLDISSLADGNYTVGVTATDTRSVSGSGTANLSIGPAPSEPTTAIVNSITYTTEGGKNSDKHLNIHIAVIDDFGNPVANASVSINLTLNGNVVGSGTGTTGSNGVVTFSYKNAPSGHYETVITGVTAVGLIWDDATPPNGYDK